MMISAMTRLGVALGLSLTLGVVLTPLGCGGKQKAVEYATAEEPVTVPDDVKEQLTDCVKRGAGRLSDTNYAIMFNVQADDDGDVRSVEIHDSMLGDQAIESCMRRALQGMTLPLSIGAMRAARSDSEGAVAPGSRALVGNPLVLAGGATVALGPIVIVAAGVTVVVAVTIYMMSEASGDDDVEEYCQNLVVECLENKKQPKWNRGTYGEEKDCGACGRECKYSKGQWPSHKCPR